MDAAQAQARLRYLELKAKAGQAQPEAKGNLYAFGSGAVRAVPQTLDLAGAAVAEGVDRLTGGEGGYFKGFLQPAMTPADDMLTAAIGPEYEAQGFSEDVSKLLGGIAGPIGSVKAARNVAGFVRGLGGSLQNYIRDPQKLREAYVAWEKGLENIPVSPEQYRAGVIDPLAEKLKYQLPFLNREGKEVVENVTAAEPIVSNARYVEGMRRSLSGNASPAAQVARQQADEFMQSSAIPTDGRDTYRRFRVLGEVDDALRNLDNETMKATRTKINNIDKTGLNAIEREALERAGRAGIGEGLLRALPIGRGSGAVTGAGAAIATGNPLTGVLMYAGGRGLENMADRAAMRRIDDLRSVLMNARPVPNLGERAGGAARELMLKALQRK